MSEPKSFSDYLTVSQVSKILNVSPDSVIRKFEAVAGVLDLGRDEALHKRRYRVLRIPREALARFIGETRVA